MDDRRFDDLARLVSSGNRRGFLKLLAGAGGFALTSALVTRDADAARRGFSGPSSPTLVADAACFPGFWRTEKGCEPCWPGTASPDGLACIACAQGTYAPNIAQSSCISCGCEVCSPTNGACCCGT